MAAAAGWLALPALAAPAASTRSAGAAVGVGDDFFAPRTLTVQRGRTVTWRWEGKKLHNVVGSGAAKFQSPLKRAGTYSRKFTRAGTVRVICTIHTGMKMTVRVR